MGLHGVSPWLVCSCLPGLPVCCQRCHCFLPPAAFLHLTAITNVVHCRHHCWRLLWLQGPSCVTFLWPMRTTRCGVVQCTTKMACWQIDPAAYRPVLGWPRPPLPTRHESPQGTPSALAPNANPTLLCSHMCSVRAVQLTCTLMLSTHAPNSHFNSDSQLSLSL